MKKLLLFLVLATSLTINSQITKDNWMVGGTGNISMYENKYNRVGNETSNKGIGMNISPNIGYFLVDRFVLGAHLGVGYTIPKDAQNSFSYGIGPYSRYYFLEEDNLINLFSELSYSFGETKRGTNKSKSNGYGLKAGAVLFFNRSVGLEVSLDYDSSKLRPKNSPSSTSNILQIGLGFQIHLEK